MYTLHKPLLELSAWSGLFLGCQHACMAFRKGQLTEGNFLLVVISVHSLYTQLPLSVMVTIVYVCTSFSASSDCVSQWLRAGCFPWPWCWSAYSHTFDSHRQLWLSPPPSVSVELVEPSDSLRPALTVPLWWISHWQVCTHLKYIEINITYTFKQT